jgi:hypothetical protein
MNWIYLDQDRVQLRALVNTIMNLWASLIHSIHVVTDKLLVS